jgi:hypothetical protein
MIAKWTGALKFTLPIFHPGNVPTTYDMFGIEFGTCRDRDRE